MIFANRCYNIAKILSRCKGWSSCTGWTWCRGFIVPSLSQSGCYKFLCQDPQADNNEKNGRIFFNGIWFDTDLCFVICLRYLFKFSKQDDANFRRQIAQRFLLDPIWTNFQKCVWICHCCFICYVYVLFYVLVQRFFMAGPRCFIEKLAPCVSSGLFWPGPRR